MGIKNVVKWLSETGIEYEERVLLSNYSTLKIGGECLLAVFPKTADDLKNTILTIHENNVIYNVVGKGSNILFDDGGYDGILIFTYKMNGIELISDTQIYAQAGAKLSSIASIAQKNGLTGAEFMHGIPGSCGGAVFMNAGAYGGEMSLVVKYTDYFNVKTEQIGRLYGEEHEFSYRESIYQERPELVVLGACLELKAGDREQIKEMMHQNMQKRMATQPLEYPNAGSAFKRPKNGYAGKMIEECGLKGYTVGGAQISEKHAGFIINIGGATSEDVIELMRIVIDKVKKKFDVELESEIRYFDPFGE